jgi:hypothetical protein
MMMEITEKQKRLFNLTDKSKEVEKLLMEIEQKERLKNLKAKI